MSGYFTGIKVPDRVVRMAIRELPLRETLGVAVWTLPCNWHSTLEWHGSDEPGDQWEEDLKLTMATIRPFDLKMVRPYVFRNRATYLCADLTGDLVSWGVLSKGTAPHVTLARPSDTPGYGRFESIPDLLNGWESNWWTVKEIHLYESKDGHYKIIDSYSLEQR